MGLQELWILPAGIQVPWWGWQWGHATRATSFSSNWQEDSVWEWSQLPPQQTPVPKPGSRSVVVLWEQEGVVLLLQGQNVSATNPGSEGLSAFSAGSCWKPSVLQGHPKRGQSISRTPLRGAEVSPQGIPVPLQPPKTQPMPEILGQPPPQPLFTQLLLPIPHSTPSQDGVRDWEPAVSTNCKPTDLLSFLQSVLGTFIIS